MYSLSTHTAPGRPPSSERERVLVSCCCCLLSLCAHVIFVFFSCSPPARRALVRCGFFCDCFAHCTQSRSAGHEARPSTDGRWIWFSLRTIFSSFFGWHISVPRGPRLMALLRKKSMWTPKAPAEHHRVKRPDHGTTGQRPAPSPARAAAAESAALQNDAPPPQCPPTPPPPRSAPVCTFFSRFTSCVSSPSRVHLVLPRTPALNGSSCRDHNTPPPHIHSPPPLVSVPPPCVLELARRQKKQSCFGHEARGIPRSTHRHTRRA